MTQDPAPPKKRLPLRWLTLAEIVGIGALVLTGLGYWDSHREREQQDRERVQQEHDRVAAEAAQGKARAQEAQQEAQQNALKHTLLLTGAPANGELRLQPLQIGCPRIGEIDENKARHRQLRIVEA